MQIHGRTRALIGVLATAFALVIPASALAAHDLGIYKVEKHFDLDSDDLSIDLSCKTGDYALDGMWRIDHADQDDDDLNDTAIGRAVDVLEAWPSAIDTYTFHFVKNAIGRAQIKVFATCIRNDTHSASGHSHTLTYTQATGYARPAGNTVNGATPWSNSPGFGQWSDSTICPSKTMVAGTGFRILYTPDAEGDPTPYLGHLSASWPTNANTTSVRGWEWAFDLSLDTAASVKFYASCLARLVPQGASTEKHKLIYRYQSSSATLAANKVSNPRHSCGAAYKAVVAGFDFQASLASVVDPFDGVSRKNPWYLGMNPQPKSRDYRFLNASGGTPSVDLYAICLNYRTT
jgi:hypothetical protein